MKDKSGFFQIVRKKYQHFAFRVPVAAEEVQPLGGTKEVARHFMLSGGEKTGAGRDVSADPGVYFVPELGKEHLVLGILGNFFNIASVHGITQRIIPYFLTAEKVFLV